MNAWVQFAFHGLLGVKHAPGVGHAGPPAWEHPVLELPGST